MANAFLPKCIWCPLTQMPDDLKKEHHKETFFFIESLKLNLNHCNYFTTAKPNKTIKSSGSMAQGNLQSGY
jgi:hypothetical protein